MPPSHNGGEHLLLFRAAPLDHRVRARADFDFGWMGGERNHFIYYSRGLRHSADPCFFVESSFEIHS